MTIKDTGDLSNTAAKGREPVSEQNREPAYPDEGPDLPGDPASWTRIEMDGFSEAIDPAELKEFLEADWTQIQADPGFKEKLRAELWRMVTSRSKAGKDR